MGPAREARYARTPSATASVEKSTSSMSDIATRAKERKAMVVARTTPPARAERRSKTSVPSHAVASTTSSEATSGTRRAAAGLAPKTFIAAAIAQ